MGFEPTAACLGSRCATTALHPHDIREAQLSCAMFHQLYSKVLFFARTNLAEKYTPTMTVGSQDAFPPACTVSPSSRQVAVKTSTLEIAHKLFGQAGRAPTPFG